jgi:transcriptional regulator of met regulon
MCARPAYRISIIYLFSASGIDNLSRRIAWVKARCTRKIRRKLVGDVVEICPDSLTGVQCVNLLKRIPDELLLEDVVLAFKCHSCLYRAEDLRKPGRDDISLTTA